MSRRRRSVRKPRRVGFNPPQIDTNQRVLSRHQRAPWPPFVVSLSNHERDWSIKMFCLAASALFGRAGPVTYLLRQKGDPNIRPDPPVLATGGTKTNRPRARCRARWAHGFGLGPPVAPLLGVEYTGTPSDGFLIASRWGLWEPGCEHPGYVAIG